MRSLVATLILLVLSWGCSKPDPAPPPPRARLIVRFLDRDAVLTLDTLPGAGPWRVMNSGQWDPLEVRWKTDGIPLGAAVVARTAPDWVLLEDPANEVHRVVMRGPGPEELARRNERLDPEEEEALAFLGMLWVLSWVRH
jgi:hypothetical protein